MKNKKLGLVIVLCALLLSSCAAKKPSEQKMEASSSQTSASTEKEAKKVLPLPATISVDNMSDCMVEVSFGAKDVSVDEAGKILIHFTVYDYELFDMVDISTLEVGDTIVVDKKDILVKTIKNENGTFKINGGYEDGGCYLKTDEDGVFFEVGPNESKSYYSIGEVTLPIAKTFTFSDSSSLDKPEEKLSADGFLAKMKKSGDGFETGATTATIAGGLITNITKTYIP
ncbi:MAG: hypothetical protein RSF33_08895 [Hydrogenoanaerobacterium sp.]